MRAASSCVGACVLACGPSIAPMAPPSLPDAALVDPDVRDVVRESTDAVLAAPNDALRWGRLGMTYAANGFEALAEACYRHARALAPDEPRVVYLLAIVVSQQSRLSEAIECLVDVQRMAPNYAPAWWQCGLWRLDCGDPRAALSDFQHARALAPSESVVAIGEAQAILDLGRTQEALDRLTEIRRTRPDTRAYVDRLLAIALQRLGRDAEAARLAGRDHSAAPRGSDPWIQDMIPLTRGLSNSRRMATHLMADGRFTDAADVLERARTTHTDDVRQLRLLAQAHRGAGHLREALSALRDAARVGPDNAQVHADLAELLAQTGDLNAARASVETALALQPDLAEAWAMKGDLSMRDGRYADARLAFRRALAGDPRNAMLRVGLALACTELRLFPEARDEALKAADLDPDRVGAWSCLALAFFELGHDQEASVALERARSLDPKDGMVQSLMQRVRTRRDAPR